MSTELRQDHGAVNLRLVPQHADDERPVLDRLRDYAERGTESPESLSLYEIRQLSFALSLYLAKLGEH